MSSSHKAIYLVKANNDLISHCKCESTYVSEPVQMDCPWCGCGWLFVCPKCRKAFTFARAEAVDLTWEELAHLDLDGKFKKQPTAERVQNWIEFMQMLTKGLEVGKQYVYIDGWVFPTDAGTLHFEGAYARHRLAMAPQVEALKDPAALDKSVGNEKYWRDRRIEQD